MVVRRYRRVSDLSKEQREELTRWAQSRTLPAGDVFRARLMLALADGKSWNQIEVELDTSRAHDCALEEAFRTARSGGVGSEA
jgi:hypothetical protein